MGLSILAGSDAPDPIGKATGCNHNAAQGAHDPKKSSRRFLRNK